MRSQINNSNQLDIFIVHSYENNSESQNKLEKRREDFGKQCGKVFDILMWGEEITTKSALLVHNIHSLPRRIMDCREQNGIAISDKWDETGKVKIWYMSDVDKIFNKKFAQLKD